MALLLAATQPTSFDSGLALVLELLVGLGALGGLLTGAVAWRKARKENELNAAQAMEVLFRNQRQVNLDKIAEYDKRIADLSEQLRSETSRREEVEAQMAKCLQERAALRAQVHGLDRTLDELGKESGTLGAIDRGNDKERPE